MADSQKPSRPPAEPDAARRPFTSAKASYQSDKRIKDLSQIIVKSTLQGALYGALVSIPVELLIRWRSPFYRSFGTRIRIFFHTMIMAYSASFMTESNVMKYEDQMRAEEARKRQELIEWSVANGLYTGEEDGYTYVPNSIPKKK